MSAKLVGTENQKASVWGLPSLQNLKRKGQNLDFALLL